MYFEKNEIIELSDGKEYLILDTLLIDNKTYYKIQEVNENSDDLVGQYKYITADKKDETIYIDENIPNMVMPKLKELFENE